MWAPDGTVGMGQSDSVYFLDSTEMAALVAEPVILKPAQSTSPLLPGKQEGARGYNCR